MQTHRPDAANEFQFSQSEKSQPASLAEVVRAFLVQARDKYGLGRFMPDELPMLDEMARLARIELGSESSAADEDGAESPTGPRGHHESVGERQGRQPAQDPPAALTPEEALAAINALRCNIIGTQSASWSNVPYPLVAILNAAGFEYVEPTDEAKREHLDCYGGAGGWPGKRATS